ncbi:MAG: hypothetical protein Q9174_003224 [Haloplaca sp. 1 TL-2023]
MADSKALLKERLAKLNASVDALPDNIFTDAKAREAVQGQISALKEVPHQSAATMVALKAGWLDVLNDDYPRSKTAAEIAAVKGGEPELIGKLAQDNKSCSPSKKLMALTLLVPGWTNGFKHFFDHCGPPMLKLPDYLARTGYKNPQDVKTGPFADTWGKNTWALYEAEPERGEIFNSFMTAWKKGHSSWFDRYPVETQLSDAYDMSDDTVLLIDIGGGGGHVLQDFVEQKGKRKNRLIVQDLPAAVSPAKDLQPLGIEGMSYDFFTPQPVQGAKAYYFRGIFHDWPDKACQEILRNTIAGMKKGYSKVLIDEMVLPDRGVTPKGAFFDLSMMVLETGSERTLAQWHELMGSVGLRIEKVWPSKAGPASLIEVVLE